MMLRRTQELLGNTCLAGLWCMMTAANCCLCSASCCIVYRLEAWIRSQCDSASRSDEYLEPPCDKARPLGDKYLGNQQKGIRDRIDCTAVEGKGLRLCNRPAPSRRAEYQVRKD